MPNRSQQRCVVGGVCARACARDIQHHCIAVVLHAARHCHVAAMRSPLTLRSVCAWPWPTGVAACPPGRLFRGRLSGRRGRRPCRGQDSRCLSSSPPKRLFAVHSPCGALQPAPPEGRHLFLSARRRRNTRRHARERRTLLTATDRGRGSGRVASAAGLPTHAMCAQCAPCAGGRGRWYRLTRAGLAGHKPRQGPR